MNRLLAAIYWDVQLQFRNGFYYAAAVVVVLAIVLLNQVPAAQLNWLLPVFVLTNLVINTFYFIGGLVLLEKGEGTLEAQVVTPLRIWEYLAAKVLTLTSLSLLENLLIVGISYGLDFGWLFLVAGIGLAGAVYSLVGFVAVARYDSINEYLLPSILYTAGLSLPLLPYFGVWQGAWVYLHPLQGPLLLMQAAFQPVSGWQVLYALLAGGLWVGLIYRYSRQIFLQFIVSKEGVR